MLCLINDTTRQLFPDGPSVLPPSSSNFLGQNEFHVIIFLSAKYVREDNLMFIFCNTSHSIAFINK